ncbi:MAG: hypothetical protein NVSMB57_11430 [Actinomycetota bacterium]
MLCLAMLADVCTIAATAGQVLVVASDIDAEAVVRAVGASVVRDPSPNAGLNPSLEAAIPNSDDGVLVIASDLPAISEADIAAVCGGNGVRVAPDTAGTGTNALWRLPGNVIPLAFGELSALRHQELAAARGVAFSVVKTPGLAMDLDLPEHLMQAWEAEIGPYTREALITLGFPSRMAP